MTERPSTPIPAGWYPDPRGTPQRRWWDGSAWTHALEPLAATPAWANLPGPVVNRAPSPSAPTVKRAIVDNTEVERPAIAAASTENVASTPSTVNAASTSSTVNAGFPTRRQLRDAEATRAMQKQLTEPSPEAPVYAVGAAGSLRAAVSAATPRVVSTAAAASISEAPVHTTGSSMSSSKTEAGAPYSPTHTFTPTPTPARPAAAAADVPAPVVAEAADAAADAEAEAARTAVAAAPVAVAPVAAAPVAAAPLSAAPGSASPITAAPEIAAPVVVAPIAAAPTVAAEPAIAAPVSAAAASPIPAAPAPDAPVATASGARKATTREPEPFRPVMRTGAQRSTVSPLGEMEYQPFGMNPRIRTGTVLRPTQVHTAPAWTIAVLPALAAIIAAAVAFLVPEMYTPFTLVGLALVVLFATVVLAVSDRRMLVLADHTRTASPAWVLLTPPAYLLARAVRTHEQAGRGWVPFIVALPVLLVAGAIILVMPVLTALV
jgi:hypothetical protein